MNDILELAKLAIYFESFVLWIEGSDILTFKIKQDDKWYNLLTEDVEHLYIPLSSALSKYLDQSIQLSPAPLTELLRESNIFLIKDEIGYE